MLHWSSTSFGYMKPSTGICTSLLIAPNLSHGTVHAVVKHLPPSRHLRLQNLHAMRFQELMNRIFGILQIGKLPRPRGTDLAASGRQPLGDAVIAKRALLRRVRLGIDEAAPIRTRLHTIPATQAVTLVHQ